MEGAVTDERCDLCPGLLPRDDARRNVDWYAARGLQINDYQDVLTSPWYVEDRRAIEIGKVAREALDRTIARYEAARDGRKP